MAKKKIITVEQIEKIRQAVESVKGTMEYRKYDMPFECRRKRFVPENPEPGFRYFSDKGWSHWNFCGWDIPRKDVTYYLKTIKGKTYIMTEEYEIFKGELRIDRYEITETVKELIRL